MRTALVILVVAILGCVFLGQRHHDQQSKSAQAAAEKTSTVRPVSEHNWAKHALDTTTKVTRQVAEKQKEDGNR